MYLLYYVDAKKLPLEDILIPEKCVLMNIILNIVEKLSNDGNFRALLRYRAKGDQFLKLYLENNQRFILRVDFAFLQK
ncbi:zinc finger MYM-type protein 1-like [Aphis craccivora]|uniref:Zinc finger MYM-type protein 1-like n=1 Tax=Aphis craccivora TaxID=307492 RepID=A0A6G0YDP1_APHCR|nr:zinc finger MYM-type protein 1-like [Aphis craccivora]